MDTQRFEPQDESLKNNDRPLHEESGRENASAPSGQPHRGTTGLADRINNIITSPTGAVRSRTHHGGTHGDTGTNVSYEGNTAPGGGGSVGTGEASGQSATGSRITGADTDEGVHHRHNTEEQGERQGTNNPYNDKRDASEETDGSGNPLQRDHDDALDRNTLGTP